MYIIYIKEILYKICVKEILYIICVNVEIPGLFIYAQVLGNLLYLTLLFLALRSSLPYSKTKTPIWQHGMVYIGQWVRQGMFI